MIDHNRKIIFIHIPKCGGSSIENAFGSFYQSGAGHTTLSNYLSMTEDQLSPSRPDGKGNIIGEQTCSLDEYFKFTFVRNPWAKMLSSYFHYCEGRDINDGMTRLIGKPVVEHFKKNCNSFKDFLRFFFQEYIPSGVIEGKTEASKINPNNSENFSPPFVGEASHREEQWKFITPINKVDFIGRLENINNDFRYLQKRLGEDLHLPHSNKTSHRHYSEYYDDEDIDFVAEKYKIDIELFNFSYEIKT